MTLTKEEIVYDTNFKFGDLVENYWASSQNPNRIGIVVRVDPKSLYLTDGKGRFWNLVRDKESKSKIIGHYSDSFLKAERERAGKLYDIVQKLADWSKKYPRGPIYPMSQKKMDDELIQIEELAKTAINEYNNKP